VVVTLTSKSGPIDKIKGSVAGSDAWLVKPCEERALLKVLAKYDETLKPGFQPTRMSPKKG
jgi:two-component system cell cycle response regulator